MAETIDWLLDLPKEERRTMENAVEYKFTMDSPAPPLSTRHVSLDWKLNACTVVAPTLQALELVVRRGWPKCARAAKWAVLNFAHGYNCGGGFEHAHGSQEEDLFRHTSLFLSLWPHRREDDGPGVLARGLWIGHYDPTLPRKEAWYPHTNCGGIYTPYVRVIRDVLLQEKGGVCPLRLGPDFLAGARGTRIGVITVAAQDAQRDEAFSRELLDEKVRTILHMAVANGDDGIILGAFGCGYFLNPPGQVAEAFHEAFTTEFADCFSSVVFAVLGDENLPAFEKYFPLISMDG